LQRLQEMWPRLYQQMRPQIRTRQPNDRDDKGRFRNPVQPRIDELTRKTREAEREAAYWRGRAQSAEKPKDAAAPPAKPTPDKFDDYGAFVEALADWKADEKIKANNDANKQESAKERAARERTERWAERSAATRARVPDFDQVLEASDVKIADFVSDALDDSERSADLVYQIAKDPSIADRLNAMTPRQAALELGRMESRLPPVSAEPDPEEVPADKPAPVPQAAPVRKTTSAPPPIKPISKGGSTAVDLTKLKGDDYVKRARHRARSGRGANHAPLQRITCPIH
jgi:hypothetical protein